ncbi:Glutathione transport system permease protein GsiD [Hyphomicrobiales bacterium]|nr:Glutathione transport system permease protein GsiD [Hyphomicrobiales bacterium]CAH1691969.1 Glutathione transport system permease protein GsiD [Hyphomicrobiales bacterium]
MTHSTQIFNLRPARRSRFNRRGLLARFSRNRLGMIALGYILFLCLVSILAPLISPYDPTAMNRGKLLIGAFHSGHILGTDELSRDVLSRLIHGTRITVLAPVIAVGIALGLGVIPGMIAGYFSGKIDVVIMRVVDALQSFPPLLLAMALVAVLGSGLVNAMLAVGIVYIPAVVRIVRSSVLAIRKETYVESALIIGTPIQTILRRHILPNAIGPLLVQTSILAAFALLAEATLSFIGLGVQAPNASWGSMLSSGFKMMSRQPTLWIWPAIAIAATVLAWNVIGDALRDSIGREDP